MRSFINKPRQFKPQDGLISQTRSRLSNTQAFKSEPQPLIPLSLRVSQPGDRFEREAEGVAEQATGISGTGGPGQSELTKMPAAHSFRPSRFQSAVSKTGGQLMPESLRHFFESRLGHDFSQVKIHTDDSAQEAAQALHARAFTLGQDVVFDRGEFQPATARGQNLLAHELAHVVQQEGGNAFTSNLLSAPLIQRQTPQRGPLTPIPNPAPASPAPSRSLPDLSRFTNFNFRAGPLDVQIVIPKSLTIRWPVALRDARSIEFKFEARTSGALNFTVKLNGIPDVQLQLSSGVNVREGLATAGISLATTRTICLADDPLAVQAEVTRAREDLTRAVNTWVGTQSQTPVTTTEETETEEPSTSDRLMEVAEKIAALYEAVQKGDRPCREVPVFSIGLAGQTPVDVTSRPPEERPPSSIGLTATFHF
ncbi:MAG: DUF4157 domain-containing protein [bacterium]